MSERQMTYFFPFPIEPKERPRARAIGGKATIYSPASTKNFYEKIRSYIMTNYPDYAENIVDFDCKVTMEIAIHTKKNKSDLDNRIKNLDALQKDRTRKSNSGFLGIFSNDKFIKWIDCRLILVPEEEQEYTTLTISPYTPFKGG